VCDRSRYAISANRESLRRIVYARAARRRTSILVQLSHNGSELERGNEVSRRCQHRRRTLPNLNRPIGRPAIAAANRKAASAGSTERIRFRVSCSECNSRDKLLAPFPFPSRFDQFASADAVKRSLSSLSDNALRTVSLSSILDALEFPSRTITREGKVRCRM